MSRRLAIACGALLATSAACSFASLDYLQNGPAAPGDDGGVAGHPPEMVADGQTAPSLLAQDDAALYWATANGVMSVAKTGGTPRKISPDTSVNSLAVDHDPNGKVFLAYGASVLSVGKGGDPAVPIFTQEDGGATPYEVAVDDASVYLLQYDDSLSIPGRVVRMGKDGSGLQVFAVAPDFDPATLNLDDTDVVWSSSSNTDMAYFETPKGAPSTAPRTLSLAASDTLPATSAEVVVTADKIFWTDETNVYARTHDTSATTVTIYQQDQDLSETFEQLAYDGTNLYALDTVNGAVRRIPPAGTKSEVVTTGMKSPSSLVVDAQYLYVTVQNTGDFGQIVRIAK